MSMTSFRALGASRIIRSLGVLAIVAGLLGAGVAQAQEAPQARIAVINTGQIFTESLLGKSYAAKIDALQGEIQEANTKMEAEAQQRNTELNTLREELQKQASVLSPEGRDKKQMEIRAKERELQAFVEDGRSEMQRMQQRAQQQAQNLNNEYQLKVRPFIEAAAKEKGVDILLDSSVALPIGQGFDISADIIAKANAGMDAAAPAAEATP